MKLTPAQSFLGMNTLLPAEKLTSMDGAFLRNAVNVDMTDAGTVKRRQGTEQELIGTDCHSFWTHDLHAFMVDGSTLYRLSESPMSLSNTTENATLKAHLQGTDPSYRAGATLNVSPGIQPQFAAGALTISCD